MTPRACWMWRRRAATKVLEQARDLVALIERAAPGRTSTRLVAVNQFFNQRIAFHGDAETWACLTTRRRRWVAGAPCRRLRGYAIAKLLRWPPWRAGEPAAHGLCAGAAGRTVAGAHGAGLRQAMPDPDSGQPAPEVLIIASRGPDAGVQFQPPMACGGVWGRSRKATRWPGSLWRDLVAKVRAEDCFDGEEIMSSDATGDLAGAGRGTGGAVGCAGVSTLGARNLVQSQLQLKNADNAQTLALALSQQGGDEALIKLLVSTQFDTGAYERLRWLGPRSARCFERGARARARERAPAWFQQLRAHQRGRWRGRGSRTAGRQPVPSRCAATRPMRVTRSGPRAA